VFEQIAENLKTEIGIGRDVILRRAFVETLHPKKRNKLAVFITRKDGTVEHLPASYNSRVDAGANWQAGIMGSAAGNPAKYIALSTASLTPAKGDTTLASETAVSGLARAAGTYGGYTPPASLGAAASFTQSKTFTNAGTTTTIQSAALFDASSAGNLFVEANLSSSATLNNGDSITITWTINL
jgi:hypothetical protein